MHTPDPIDISVALPSVDDLKSSPPFVGTTTVVYPYVLTEDERELTEGVGQIKRVRWEKIDRFAPYFGSALLLDVSNNMRSEITAQTLIDALSPIQRQLEKLPPSEQVLPPRLIVKTRKPHIKANEFHSYLSVDAIEFLYAQDFGLVGIDAPSINQPNGDDLAEWHFKDREMVWLVNLDLSKCKGSGRYLLIAIPLIDVEDGPVPARALLVPTPTD